LATDEGYRCKSKTTQSMSRRQGFLNVDSWVSLLQAYSSSSAARWPPPSVVVFVDDVTVDVEHVASVVHAN